MIRVDFPTEGIIAFVSPERHNALILSSADGCVRGSKVLGAVIFDLHCGSEWELHPSHFRTVQAAAQGNSKRQRKRQRKIIRQDCGPNDSTIKMLETFYLEQRILEGGATDKTLG